MSIPNLRGAMRGWTRTLSGYTVAQTVVDHIPTEVKTAVTIKGNLQPTPAQEVDRKPESQRSWRWWNLIQTSGDELFIDSIVVFGSIRYRVNNKSDWHSSGFRKYQLIEDYQEST